MADGKDGVAADVPTLPDKVGPSIPSAFRFVIPRTAIADDHCLTVFFLLILALAARSMAFFIHAASCVASSTTSAGTS